MKNTARTPCTMGSVENEIRADGDGAATRPAAEAGRTFALVHRVVFLLFALIYLALTAGWAVVVSDNGTELGSPLAQMLYVLGLALAVAAAPLWFLASALLARTLQSRALWMLAGVVVLVPWPGLIK